MIRVLLLLLPFLAAPAAAQHMVVVESAPRAAATMDGPRQEFRVRFDRPVNHNASRLIIERDGIVVRRLPTRLGASPDTLYAVAGGLLPGAYVLRWRTGPRDGETMTEGALDFTVRP